MIVDLAGESGGNCELTVPGETVIRHDVKIISPLNLPASMAEHSSQLFARNVLSLLELLIGEDGALHLDFDDEIVSGACIVRDGEIVHPGAKAATEADRMILASVLITNLAILVLAGFVGFVVISKVPNTLHTPLMSGTNAIHGIVLLGGLLVVGLSGNSAFNKVILVIAIAFGTINIVGGFLVTDRMLEMFKSKPKPKPGPARARTGPARARPGESQIGIHPVMATFLQAQSFLDVLYIIAFGLFIQGLRGLSGPTGAVAATASPPSGC